MRRTMHWRAARILIALAVAAGPAVATDIPNVVVLGWDGVQLEHLQDELAAGNLRNLELVADEGGLHEFQITTHYQSSTVPGWMALLTSLYPEDNGNLNLSAHHNTSIPDGWTMFERLHAIDPDARQAWFTSKNFTDIKPRRLFANLVDDFDELAAPYYMNGDAAGTMDELGDGARALIEQHDFTRPLLMFVHFAYPDIAGHCCGENSTLYADSLLATPERPRGDPLIDCQLNPSCNEDRLANFRYGIDYHTGRIVRALRDRGVWDDTHFYVVTDHGFVEDGTNHLCNLITPAQPPPECRDIWLVTNRPEFAMDSPEMVEFADAVLTTAGHGDRQHLRTRAGTFELGLDDWTTATSGTGSTEIEETVYFSWPVSARIDANAAESTATLSQPITPLPAAGEPLEAVAYAHVEAHGDGGQSLTLHGTNLDTGEPGVIGRIRVGSDGIFGSAAGIAENPILVGGVPAGRWARLKIRVEPTDDGHTLRFWVNPEGSPEPTSISVIRDFPVEISTLEIGDAEVGPTSGGRMLWDDVRAHAQVTANDFWEVEWLHFHGNDPPEERAGDACGGLHAVHP